MGIIVEKNESKDLDHLEEMIVNVYDGLPAEIENSVFYPKLKQLLFVEITRFCKEQYELKEDLLIFRNLVGDTVEEYQIREYLDNLKAKYNNSNTNIGLNYHIEATRIDLSCVVFVVVKRADIHMKKFVFRFRKKNFGANVDGIAPGGLFEI